MVTDDDVDTPPINAAEKHAASQAASTIQSLVLISQGYREFPASEPSFHLAVRLITGTARVHERADSFERPTSHIAVRTAIAAPAKDGENGLANCCPAP